MSEPLTFEQHMEGRNTTMSEYNVAATAWSRCERQYKAEIDAHKADVAYWRSIAIQADEIIEENDVEIERLTRERDSAEAAALERAIKTAKATQFRCHAADDVDFHSGCVQTKESIIDNLGKLRSDQQSSALERVKAQARLEEHDATCDECKMHLDLKDSAIVTDTEFCPRHSELEARRKS
jgi:hypothetical protein